MIGKVCSICWCWEVFCSAFGLVYSGDTQLCTGYTHLKYEFIDHVNEYIPRHYSSTVTVASLIIGHV